MIKIYFRIKSEVSTRKTFEWFEANHIPVKSCSIFDMDEVNLRKILQLSEGFQEITRASDQSVYEEFPEKLGQDEITVNDMIQFILHQPTVLRTPLIIDKAKLLVGFNEFEIRRFIPKSKRKIEQSIRK